MSKKSKAYQAPTHEEIAACAQISYEREGRPEGQATEHWLLVEAQLIARTQAPQPRRCRLPDKNPRRRLSSPPPALPLPLPGSRPRARACAEIIK